MGSAAGVRKVAATRIGISLAEYDAHLDAGEKWCRTCKAWQPREDFGTDNSRGDGLTSACLASFIRATGRPGRAERIAAASRGEAWCRDCLGWRHLAEVRGGICREHRNADYRARYANDGESIRQRVYARKRSLDPIPGWWVEDHREDFGGLCAYGCQRAATSNDHIWPVARGGQSHPGNLVPACPTCNSQKRDGDPEPWVARGVKAFPDQWIAVIALAFEHGTDEWTGVTS